MERTLHYKVMNKDDITLEERRVIRQISDTCSEESMKTLFSCESFYLDEQKLSGSCRVDDDETNAMLALCALVAISKRTEATFAVYDEGGFLRVPIVLKSGRAKPGLDGCLEEWERGNRHETLTGRLSGPMLEEMKVLFEYEDQGYTSLWNFVRFKKVWGAQPVTAVTAE